jgi:hypothetical protein
MKTMENRPPRRRRRGQDGKTVYIQRNQEEVTGPNLAQLMMMMMMMTLRLYPQFLQIHKKDHTRMADLLLYCKYIKLHGNTEVTDKNANV